MGPCCAPGSDGHRTASAPSKTTNWTNLRSRSTTGMVLLGGGPFLMGSDDPDGYPDDGEGPVRLVDLRPFWVDTTAVANIDFRAFVHATGHVTEAERFGWSFVFGGLLPDDFPLTRGVAAAPWWRQVEGADWAHPEGRHSSVTDRLDHPAVHVSWHDASSFAAWAGKRLLTEAEWEFAARGGLVQKRFPWGDQREPGGTHRMNVWQGTFPSHNTVDDGWNGTALSDAFPPNGYGLHNMTGNVWEWCADAFTAGHGKGGGEAPGRTRVTRGGSYLCHESY